MIIFTEHAETKLKQRKISKDLVAETLNNPSTRSKGYANRIIFHKKFGGRYLSVVAKQEKGNTIIITSYWVARLRK